MNETLQQRAAATLLFSLLLPGDLMAEVCPEDAASTQYLSHLQQRVAKQDEAAILTLAEHYLKGTGLPRDMSKGLALYQTLAKRDHPEAEFRLGLIYLNGYG